MRPFTHVTIWASTYPDVIKSERSYIVTCAGDIRDLKRHRSVRPATFERHVQNAMADGQLVSFEVCKPDFSIAQKADFQRTTND